MVYETKTWTLLKKTIQFFQVQSFLVLSLLHCLIYLFFFYEVNVDCFVVNVHTYHLDMGDLSKNIHYGQLLWHVLAAGKKEFIVNGKLYNVLHMFKMLFKP